MDKIKLNLFEKAKQAVAEKHGYLPFYLATKVMGQDIHYTEAAELYSQWIANAAVKADRAETTNEAYYDSFQDDHVVSCKVLNRQLPFPDAEKI